MDLFQNLGVSILESVDKIRTNHSLCFGGGSSLGIACEGFGDGLDSVDGIVDGGAYLGVELRIAGLDVG